MDFLAIEADATRCAASSRATTPSRAGGRATASAPAAVCACKKSCQCDIISGYGALCDTGGAEGGEELAVCQACAMPLNASGIFIANGKASTGLAVA